MQSHLRKCINRVILLLVSFIILETDSSLIRVATSEELIAAVETVQPGDEIVVASGSYSPLMTTSFINEGHLTLTTSGTEDSRIILRGEDPDNPPSIVGTDLGYWSVIRLSDGANYWTIQDLILSNANKGVVVDASNFVELKRLQVKFTGEEAIHVRDGSKNTLIEDCQISDTGQVNPGYGEGVYVGSDRDMWVAYMPDVAFTTIRGCKIGPNVRGEAFDIKEGTTDTIIEYCSIDASGLSGDNFADSFVDIKGSKTFVRFNTFLRNGESSLLKGVAIIDREVNLSADQNVIHDNVFDLDDDLSIPIVSAGGQTTETIAFDNIRTPDDGELYSGDVSMICCPDWYQRPTRLEPTSAPVSNPTGIPSTESPIEVSISPSRMPTVAPVEKVTAVPSEQVTLDPSSTPILSPSSQPVLKSSSEPTSLISTNPSSQTSQSPSFKQSLIPVSIPTTTTPSSGPSETKLVPSPAPMQANIPSSNTSFCDDSDTETFLVPSIGKLQHCVWLYARTEFWDEVCGSESGKMACPELCLVCSDDCEDSEVKFFVGDDKRDCLWLRLRPHLKKELCLTDSAFEKNCPETCDVCDGIKAGNFPPTEAPTIPPVPEGYLCDDDNSQTFRVDEIAQDQHCIWLAARPDFIKTYCTMSHPSKAYDLCAETCGKCVDDCRDTNANFDIFSKPRNCEWLSIRPDVQKVVCVPENPAYTLCPETCNTCDGTGTLAPIPAPLPVPTTTNCDDSVFGEFFVKDLMVFQRCVWLAARPEWQKTLCQVGDPSNARTVCAETCNSCSDTCEDTDRTFQVGNTKRDCLWLSLRPTIHEDLCSNEDTQIACPETCNLCDI
jgi:Right handed beta helix region